MKNSYILDNEIVNDHIFSDAARENLQLISHNVQDAYFNRGLGWKKKKKKGKKGKKKKKK